MAPERFTVVAVGHVESPIHRVEDAPRQGDEADVPADIVFTSDARPAAADLAPGDRIVVLTWLHEADRDARAVHPRGDPARPLTGVFSTRSPSRPNPIGLHEAEVLAVSPERLSVRGLEAIDGTPVVDIKPVLGRLAER